MQTRAKQNLSEAELAWAAGFVDGEGYIGVIRAKTKRGLYYSYITHVEVAQAKAAPIIRFKEMFGGNVKFVANRKQGYWYWRTFSRETVPILKQLLPYLFVKKEQALLVIEFAKTDSRLHGLGHWRNIPLDITETRKRIWAACVRLNGGRALRAERLSSEAPSSLMGDAIVRPHGNNNREKSGETLARLSVDRSLSNSVLQ